MGESGPGGGAATYQTGAAGVEQQHGILVLALGAGAEVVLGEVGGVDEGLEAGEFELGKTHA